MSFATRVRCMFLVSALAGATLAAGSAAIADQPAPDFGTPPSGEIPILFNDHHVYAKPDRLRANRVLAALVKGGTILVPLRSMFEQTGATVSYDAASKTVDVTKPGADVKVTIGKPIVTINGEDRPLDVPPEMYKGTLVVPLRVISEGMGAYVQWLPDKRIVIVRYNPAPPSPTPPPAMTPAPPPPPTATAAPTATPAPTPKPYHYEAFAAGDYNIDPTVYNEISPGNKGRDSYNIKGGFEFPLFGIDMLADADYRTVQYDHNSFHGVSLCAAGTAGCSTVRGSDPTYQYGGCPSADPGCVTVVGYPQTIAAVGLGQAYVPGFVATEDDVDVHLSFKVADPRIFVGAGYDMKHYNYLGYPNLNSLGFGIEKIPDFDQPFSVYGSMWYYPDVSGNYRYPTSVLLPSSISGQSITLSYSTFKYGVGATIDIGKSPLYIDLGYAGEHSTPKLNAPSATSITSPFAGLGLHF